MSAIANRCHNGQPESFKAEDVYIVGSESFLDLAERAKVHRAGLQFETAALSPLASERRKNLKPNTPGKRLSSARSHGPA
jgi:hypothetical protein